MTILLTRKVKGINSLNTILLLCAILIIFYIFTAPSELARMYPTPPSLENNPALSPMTSIEAPPEMHPVLVEGISVSNIKSEVTVGSTFADELLMVSLFRATVFPSII